MTEIWLEHLKKTTYMYPGEKLEIIVKIAEATFKKQKKNKQKRKKSR